MGIDPLGDVSSMKSVSDLQVRIFADGADKSGMLEMYSQGYIKGFTTNPTLMRKADIRDYRAFALDILEAIPDRPISFEVFSDEFEEMEKQALEINSWGKNVFVKIPVTNTRRESSGQLIHRLALAGIKVNVTAIMSSSQVKNVVDCIRGGAPCYISVFAGRIADTGRDPIPLLIESLELLKTASNAELIWASPRELLNIFQADEIGCHIITVTNDILKKLSLVGKDLEYYSLETVQMFYHDAQKAGYCLDYSNNSR
jgi:transaldolase